MYKIKLIALFVLSAWLIQGCKKDTVTSTVSNPNITLQALVNGSTWDPDTISTSVTFNSALKNKVFNLQATLAQKRVNMTVQINTNSNTNGFPLGTYSVDNTTNTVLQYFTQQKDANGNYVFVQKGTVGPASGSITISAVDSVNKVVSGSFGLLSRQPNYDSAGNIISIDINEVSSGVFNKLPYTFVSK